MSQMTRRELLIKRGFHLRRERKLLELARDTSVTSKVRYAAVVMAEEFREHIDKIDARLNQLKAQSHG